ncbi:uncharacterized protein Pyn_36363 [Prunus yedoensis var. nudiflora]|uniref:Uncharacterized protein n=1 Tax=Prunus yedoensis var. nudiflora TaxID=2094558 RepID=A0A314UR77_PRUYE|nr:uncharacterized protein Pyn_36363 [Prunus yedoensis var. nudiflora]
MHGMHQETETFKEASSSKDEMDHAQALVVAKAHTAARKGRKDKGKNKITGCKNAVDVRKFERSVMEASSSSVIPEDYTAKCNPVSGDSAFQNITDCSAGCNILVTNLIPPDSANGPTKDEDATQSIQENYVIGSSASFCRRVSKDYQSSDNITEIQIKSTGSETGNCEIVGNVIPSVPVVDDNAFSHKDIDFQNTHVDQEHGNPICDTGASSSFECLPYEWPGVACAYFPPVNSHLPPAADRLHLDVGHNWQNHFRQSFLPQYIRQEVLQFKVGVIQF